DIAQRLAMVQIELGWSFDIDEDLLLSMMQWSALTRVLRELVSNIIVHASATRVDIVLRLQQRRLRLSITDDGRGRQPAAWSNGLGLGGVRKRVKLLGGEVRWRENLPRGIVCEVEVAEFGPRR
ncbi:MAG: ATP-binding protein, partial [Rubrivivax sp.]|nr:ATP-binding protein [Rubrivivax sp.]